MNPNHSVDEEVVADNQVNKEFLNQVVDIPRHTFGNIYHIYHMYI